MPDRHSLKKKVIFIVGPTATGKSEIAAYLCKKIKGEVICCDSMQVYKGFSILTSKPQVKLKKMARHHLFAVVPVDKKYDVFSFRSQAVKKAQEIISRGKVPVFTGGTGLYMSVLADGIFEGPKVDPLIRRKLYRIYSEKGSNYLHSLLKKADPLSAARIHFNDAKRIIRALEVFKATGKPISFWQKKRRGLRDTHDVRIFCLDMDRALLYKRINERVDSMFRCGLVREVRAYLKQKISTTLFYAIGLKEVLSYLKGQCSLEECSERIKVNTRRYAKRQLTWFRKDKGIIRISIKKGDKPESVAKEIFRRAFG